MPSNSDLHQFVLRHEKELLQALPRVRDGAGVEILSDQLRKSVRRAFVFPRGGKGNWVAFGVFVSPSASGGITADLVWVPLADQKDAAEIASEQHPRWSFEHVHGEWWCFRNW